MGWWNWLLEIDKDLRGGEFLFETFISTTRNFANQPTNEFI